MMRFAVIPTHDRPEKYAKAVAAIRTQVDQLITIAHRPGGVGCDYATGIVVPYFAEVPNISDMWNLGLDRAAEFVDGAPHAVAVLNDDAEVPKGWFDRVHGFMVEEGAHLGSGGRNVREPTKLAGHAFIIDQPSAIRPDPRWAWWYSDDILEEQAIAAETGGGLVVLSDLIVKHAHRNQPKGSPLATISEAARKAWKRGER
jgi:hypothetical protein